MSPFLRMTVIGGLLLGAAQVASAQVSHTFTFDGTTDEGWGGAFDDDAGRTNPIVNIGGSNRMQVSNTDAFQETAVGAGVAAVGDTGNSFFEAMKAAATNPADYELSYDWYVDTTGANAQFLQFGSYVNTGSGYYAQNFPGTGKEAELDGTQLSSGQSFSGTVRVPFTTYGAIPGGRRSTASASSSTRPPARRFRACTSTTSASARFPSRRRWRSSASPSARWRCGVAAAPRERERRAAAAEFFRGRVGTDAGSAPQGALSASLFDRHPETHRWTADGKEDDVVGATGRARSH